MVYYTPVVHIHHKCTYGHYSILLFDVSNVTPVCKPFKAISTLLLHAYCIDIPARTRFKTSFIVSCLC